MVDFIQSEFKKIILKCCKKHEGDVVLVLGLDEEGQNTYTILEYLYDYDKNQMAGYNWDNQKSLTINEVLGVLIDFRGYSMLAQPFIQKSIVRFSEKYKLPYYDISIFCFPTTNEHNKPDIDIYLYDGRTNDKSRYLETISFADLFNEEDMIPTT